MNYSSTALKHFTNPNNVGRLDDASAVGQAGSPGQGNFMVVYLRVASGRVTKATFQTYGCPAAIASGSITTELVTGRTLEEAAQVTAQTILDALGGLPLGRAHCADLAAMALGQALARYAFTATPSAEGGAT